jgi:hypothetical protein
MGSGAHLCPADNYHNVDNNVNASGHDDGNSCFGNNNTAEIKRVKAVDSIDDDKIDDDNGAWLHGLPRQCDLRGGQLRVQGRIRGRRRQL